MSTVPRHPTWYREWFGREYLALYPTRDAEEARMAVDLVLGVFGDPHGRILDLACGAGRHMLEFERRGYRVVGLDLSAVLLAEARARSPSFRLVRGDMRRIPFGDACFELVVNFFTSFGYFSDPDEDALVLQEIRRVLRPGGWFALDFLNSNRVRKNLTRRDEHRIDRHRVVQERHLEHGGSVVAKVIRIYDLDDNPIETYQERVRLYDPEELASMLRDAGFEPEVTFGDYAGASLRPDSPRCILLGRAAAT